MFDQFCILTSIIAFSEKIYIKSKTNLMRTEKKLEKLIDHQNQLLHKKKQKKNYLLYHLTYSLTGSIKNSWSFFILQLFDLFYFIDFLCILAIPFSQHLTRWPRFCKGNVIGKSFVKNLITHRKNLYVTKNVFHE